MLKNSIGRRVLVLAFLVFALVLFASPQEKVVLASECCSYCDAYQSSCYSSCNEGSGTVDTSQCFSDCNSYLNNHCFPHCDMECSYGEVNCSHSWSSEYGVAYEGGNSYSVTRTVLTVSCPDFSNAYNGLWCGLPSGCF